MHASVRGGTVKFLRDSARRNADGSRDPPNAVAATNGNPGGRRDSVRSPTRERPETTGV